MAPGLPQLVGRIRFLASSRRPSVPCHMMTGFIKAGRSMSRVCTTHSTPGVTTTCFAIFSWLEESNSSRPISRGAGTPGGGKSGECQGLPWSLCNIPSVGWEGKTATESQQRANFASSRVCLKLVRIQSTNLRELYADLFPTSNHTQQWVLRTLG